MDNQYLKNIGRRNFLRILSSIPLFSFTFPSIYYFIFWRPRNSRLVSFNKSQHNYKFFTEHQANVVESITSFIIPSENGPGAIEARLVFKIDELVSRDDNLKFLYTNGIEQIDSISKELFSKINFLDLDNKEKLRFLNLIAPKGTNLPSDGITFKDRRKALMAILFFQTLKNQSMELFYSSKLGWESVGYQGPPQWSGNPDYDICGL